MKINFTKREYRTLLELLYVADWVLHAHDTEENPDTARHRELCQRVKSHYKEMGCEDLIERLSDGFFETRRFEDAMLEIIDRYDEISFWEGLIDRLAARDAQAEVGLERLRSMDDLERVKLIHSKEEQWDDEFTRHGLARLRVSTGAD